MAERLPCEFFLIRYVPDVVKGEFVNIGVLLREAAARPSPEGNRSRVRFTRDWARVRCVDADADLGLLESLEQEIAERLQAGVSAKSPKGVLETLEDSLSNSIQLTPPRATLAESLTAELEQLMRMYVEPLKVARTRTRGGRAALTGAMRTEFERAGVWPLLRKRIAASLYTRPGDPLRLDFGYKANGGQAAGGYEAGSYEAGSYEAGQARPGDAAAASGLVRIFQAVSLAGDVEAAKGLAFSAPQLQEGVGRVERALLELTAVVEPLRAVSDDEAGEDEAAERYRFGVEILERQQIRVLTLNDLARAAETARRELGL